MSEYALSGVWSKLKDRWRRFIVVETRRTVSEYFHWKASNGRTNACVPREEIAKVHGAMMKHHVAATSDASHC